MLIQKSRSYRKKTSAMIGGGLTDIASGLTRGSGQARKPPPRPIPQDIIDFGNRYSLAQRIQCLTLITEVFRPQALRGRRV
jgi:hypothetical protein